MATCAAASWAGWTYKGKLKWKIILLPVFLLLGKLFFSTDKSLSSW